MSGRRHAPFVIAVVSFACCLLTPPAGHTQDLYGCERPNGMPPVPDGSTATLDEMQVARESVELFLDEGEAFVACLSTFPTDPVTATLRDQVISEMDIAAVRFNSALCAYSDGTQCARATSHVDQQSPGMATTPGGAEADATGDDFFAVGEQSADYLGPTPWERVEITAASTDTGAWPSGPQSRATAREPSLPDGAPCGSVMQTRNDTSGEGSSLRGHYQWEVYNACIDPIVMRWTFSGDGVLDAKRTIAGRDSLGFGCSTTAGRTSTRRCTGQLQYLFEWP